MEDDRPWDGLMPDTLGLIFRKLPLQEILSVVPRVCKSWAGVVRGPYCWNEIDIEEWGRFCEPGDVDRMLRMLISRSGGSLRKLRVYGLTNVDTLSLVADNAKSLQDLQLPRSDISDPIFEQVAPRLTHVTSLDLSYCTKIGPAALESLGKHCKSLTTLLRNMHPWDNMDRRSQDGEAQAIATTMPNLRRLELAYARVSTESLVRLVTGLRDLELLDVRGCWNVKLDQDLLDKVSKLRVVGPLVPDSCDAGNGPDCFSGFLQHFAYREVEYYDDDAWEDMDDDMWGDGEDGVGLDDVLFDYFGMENGEFDWPQSP